MVTKNYKYGIRFADNPTEYRRRLSTERYKNPERKKKQAEYYKNKWANDPDWRKKRLEGMKRYELKLKNKKRGRRKKM